MSGPSANLRDAGGSAGAAAGAGAGAGAGCEARRAPEVLLVNPNTNSATTTMLARIAEEHLLEAEGSSLAWSEGPRIRVRAVSVATGPSVIVDEVGLHAAESAVLECARREVRPETVAIVVGAIGDPGVAALRAAFTLPVVGIGEASARAAAQGGRRFGIVTTTPLLTGSLHALGRRFGPAGSFTGVRLTDSSAVTLAGDPARQLRELERACLLCRETDGAEAVVIGGGPLGSSARELAALLGMVIVQPVPSAIDEVLAQLGSGAGAGAGSGDGAGAGAGDGAGDLARPAATAAVLDVLDVL